jgi:hypothetical protein
MKLLLLFLVLVLLAGCEELGPHVFTNEETIAEIKKCEAAGLRVHRIKDDFGRTRGIVCIPRDEKDEK